MTRDTRKVRLVEGQTDLGWGQDEGTVMPDRVVLSCRECFSTRVVPPIVRTVDPRWVHGTCLDCGDRVIANVYTPSQKGQEPDAME